MHLIGVVLEGDVGGGHEFVLVGGDVDLLFVCTCLLLLIIDFILSTVDAGLGVDVEVGEWLLAGNAGLTIKDGCWFSTVLDFWVVRS